MEWCTNARDWDTGATSNGYPLCDDPKQDVIFQCEANTTECGSGGYGHVGWVETAYANGSIDVTEQGCYSWYGVRSRHIEAQNASPPMHYIYDKTDSCGQTCECDPGDEETRDCSRCGTETRTCGSDCHWNSWSTCDNQGECEAGDTEQQSCPRCGTETRTCGSDCHWNSWSTCDNQGECEAGDTENCGDCGGTRTCESDCHWGECQEVCADGGLDAGGDLDAVARDGMGPGADVATDVDGTPSGDAVIVRDGAASEDSGQRRTPSSIRGGCQCGTEGGPVSVWWLGLLLVWGIAVRRRTHR